MACAGEGRRAKPQRRESLISHQNIERNYRELCERRDENTQRGAGRPADMADGWPPPTAKTQPGESLLSPKTIERT